MLNWRTYGALPVLRSYAAALAHFNLVQPIRGDANGTKPAGRRDQKWLSIYKRETDNAVCIGSTWSKERPLIAYYPDGRVGLEGNISATCRERIQRITGLNIQRRYNADWVHAVAHVDGEEVIGQYKLGLNYNNKARKAFFILHENKSATYLNPVPVYKHYINKKAKAEVMKPYKPFIDYVEVMSKLSADDTDAGRSRYGETVSNPRVPALDYEGRKALGVSHHNLRYSPDGQPEFLGLIKSGEAEQWYKAMIWLSTGHWRMLLNEARLNMRDIIYQQHRDELFTKARVDAGRCVEDRYGRYF